MDKKRVGQRSTRVIFLPGRKNNAIRRYWTMLFFFVAASALFIGLFSGYWSTSVAPVLELNSENPAMCDTLGWIRCKSVRVNFSTHDTEKRDLLGNKILRLVT